ncbi:MAG TPA: DNA-3-methyladenine glycosylase [Bacteroidales bacterium]
MKKLDAAFFCRDVLEVAPDLIGKVLVRRFTDGTVEHYKITETEAYRGEEDLACHASKGRTPRTEVMYHKGGKVYVYLIYGMYQMLNFVTAGENNPQAVLIRGIEGFEGPGKLTKHLQIDKSFYGEDLAKSERLWVENDGILPGYVTGKRVGIDYAGPWKEKLWRFTLSSK